MILRDGACSLHGKDYCMKCFRELKEEEGKP